MAENHFRTISENCSKARVEHVPPLNGKGIAKSTFLLKLLLISDLLLLFLIFALLFSALLFSLGMSSRFEKLKMTSLKIPLTPLITNGESYPL